MYDLSQPGSGSKQSGCLKWVLLGLLAAGLAGGWWWLERRARRSAAPEEVAPPAPTTLEATTEPAAAPLAAPTRPRSASPAPPAASTGLSIEAVRARIEQARQLEAGQEWGAARALLFEALEQAPNEAVRREAEHLLGVVHIRMVFSAYPMPEKTEYSIARGDTLAVLARRFGSTVEAIRRGNNIRGSLIHPGQRLRILTGTFSMEVSKTRNELLLLLDGRFFKRYPVGTGEFGKTPEGQFKTEKHQAQPVWWRPDGRQFPYGHPENVLGTHWLGMIALDDPSLRGYGIHGTWEPESIGHQASAGCIRLLNEDVEELFALVPEGTMVQIKR